MTSFVVDVKDSLLKIGTKEKPVNPWKWFLRIIVFAILFFVTLDRLKFIIESGVALNWLNFVFTFVFLSLTGIAIIFFGYGLLRYGISRNR